MIRVIPAPNDHLRTSDPIRPKFQNFHGLSQHKKVFEG